ncbi:MAG: T9SS type A sorting domain-containing protein [Bacteroidetes bacterium]|nr:T9SS type A sorting domain-containing protein [Bacteroidota bacterium]
MNDGWISITAVTAPSGLNDLDATALEIYPNPTQSSVVIKTTDVRMNEANIQICNTTGEIVLQSKLKNGTAQLDLESIPAGVYMAFIINDQQQRIVKKIIKQ